MAARFRVVLHDHMGFGLSEKPPGVSYSLADQAERAIGVWQKLGLERVHLLAHDYGTSVATELLARREESRLPVELASVTLCNGSIHMDLARPRLSQYLLKSRLIGPIFARQVGEKFFKRRMRALWGDPSRADGRDLEALFEALVSEGGRVVLPKISRYLEERVEYKERWVGALRRVDLPMHVLWAREDPVAVAAIAERLVADTPAARLTWLEDLGHYPMLEDPAAWSEAVLSFLLAP